MVMAPPRVPGSGLSYEDEEALLTYGGTRALEAARTETQPRIAPQSMGTEQEVSASTASSRGFGEVVDGDRKSAPTLPPAPPPVVSYWESQAAQAAERHGLDPAYFVKQIRQESGFADDVISGRRKSSAGAIGIAQFMPATAKAYGIDPLKPIEALDGAARYVKDNLAQFGGDYRKAFAAYNAGAGGVQRAIDRGGDAWESYLPGETRAYLAAIFGSPAGLEGRALGEAAGREAGALFATAKQDRSGVRIAPNAAISQSEANRYTDEAGRLGAGYQYEQMPDDEYRDQLVGRVAAKLRANRTLQKLTDEQIEGSARSLVAKQMGANGDELDPYRDYDTEARGIIDSLPLSEDRDFVAGAYQQAKSRGIEGGELLRRVQDAARETGGNAKAVGPLARPFDPAKPMDWLGASGGLGEMAGEALATLADPAIQAALPEELREPVRRAIELAPQFYVLGGGARRGLQGLKSTASVTGGAVVGGEVTEAAGAGRAVGELAGGLAGGIAGGLPARGAPIAGVVDEGAEAAARTAVPKPSDLAGNIRLTKYPEDLRATIKQWADENPDAVQAARRGVKSDAEVLADAKELVDDVGGDFGRLQRRWKSGDAWNAEEVTAIRGTLRAKTDDVLAAAQAAKVNDSSENQARLLLAIQEQARVQEVVHGVTAEAGRALRAFRQEVFDATKTGDTQKLQELLRRVGVKKPIGEITEELSGALGKLDLDNPVAVNAFLRSMQKPALWDYVMELWINSILSGPKTHIINALSNTVTAVTSPIERATAAGVENVLAPLQGRKVARFFSEAPADAVGALQGIPEGINAALRTIRDGITPAQASKWEFRKTAFRGTLGRVVRAPGTALEAADALNYSINYRSALNALIVRQARSEGLSGAALVDRIATLKGEPTESLIKNAAATAEYRLFRQEPGEITSAVMRLRDTVPPLRFVLPFLRTPVNLLKFGLERSPVGFFNPSLWRNLAAKNPEASDQIARAFLGSTLAAGVAWQFGQGKITGGAPKNAAERDKFYREGKLPFAINVGGEWVAYQRIEPLNQTLSLVAAAVEAIGDEEATASEKITQASSSIANNLVSQTYLSGLNDLLGVLTQEDVSGAKGRAFLGRYVSGFVPGSSLLRTAAQATDPVFRQPRTVTESVKAIIPGLSQDVPAKLNVWGEEVGRESPAISPVQVTPAKVNPLDAELGRLKVDVGFVGTSIGGEILKREEQRQYQTLAGQASKAVLDRRIRSAAYQLLSDEDKEKAIEQAVAMVRDAARDTLRPDPDKPSIRGEQPIADFVLEHLDYFDKRERLGYNREDADRVALDKANPDIDAAGWKWGGKNPPALQTAAGVNQALAMDLPNRPVKLANLARAINDDAKSREAWKYSEKAVTVYYETLTDRAGDAEAQRLYKKAYAQLDKDEQSRVKGNLREQVREQTPELDAWLMWWGSTDVLKTKAALSKLQEIIGKYGNKPPKPDWKPRLAEDAR